MEAKVDDYRDQIEAWFERVWDDYENEAWASCSLEKGSSE